ncbi:cysteine hydrolase family protein [Phyllobacterium sp. OV277]|uniref:cysteine hydrolase family protein n=1 Tax=Phyllobacterium sp. OV277 TaxID=1882772 RepID=UPI0008830714|nr:cysteine hydrolase family protein [Phyllobacterium sp. OV277]SDO50087.1 Nicotinamidase-related amidase [Phyllobacterium sp. OV277]
MSVTQALLVIDVQHAIDDPKWGRRGQPEAEQHIARLLGAWRERRLPIVHIKHDSTDPQSPYRPGTEGNEFKSEVAPQVGEPVVDKRTNNAFIGTDLMDVLDELQVRSLVVTGVLLENSVDATVRMAANLGFEVVVPEDAVASIDRKDHQGKNWSAEDVHALTLSILDGEYAKISTSDAIIEALP